MTRQYRWYRPFLAIAALGRRARPSRPREDHPLVHPRIPRGFPRADSRRIARVLRLGPSGDREVRHLRGDGRHRPAVEPAEAGPQRSQAHTSRSRLLDLGRRSIVDSAVVEDIISLTAR